MSYEEIELLNRMKRVGLRLKPVAMLMELRPSTLSNKLQGWSRLLPKERNRIEQIIIEAEKKNHK